MQPARYGTYNGATVNAVTRSGSNAFHGSMFEFVRHRAFDSIAFFDRAENGSRSVDDGLKRSQYGAENIHMVWGDARSGFQGTYYGTGGVLGVRVHEIATRYAERYDSRRNVQAIA